MLPVAWYMVDLVIQSCNSWLASICMQVASNKRPRLPSPYLASGETLQTETTDVLNDETIYKTSHSTTQQPLSAVNTQQRLSAVTTASSWKEGKSMASVLSFDSQPSCQHLPLYSSEEVEVQLQLHELIKQCWQHRDLRRPTAEAVQKKLQALIRRLG